MRLALPKLSHASWTTSDFSHPDHPNSLGNALVTKTRGAREAATNVYTTVDAFLHSTATSMSAAKSEAATANAPEAVKRQDEAAGIRYVSYGTEKESPYLPAIRQLISKDLSEPYSIYVYRYFLYQWGELCFMALDPVNSLIGVIVCKLEPHRSGPLRGYIAMLATRSSHRGQGIASRLVRMAVTAMTSAGADEIALETEVDNIPSLRIYENLGFLRTKRLHRYYLNGNTAFRLVLYLKEGIPYQATYPPEWGGEEMAQGQGQGQGLGEEDLVTRQAAGLQIEEVEGQRFDVTGSDDW